MEHTPLALSDEDREVLRAKRQSMAFDFLVKGKNDGVDWAVSTEGASPSEMENLRQSEIDFSEGHDPLNDFFNVIDPDLDGHSRVAFVEHWMTTPKPSRDYLRGFVAGAVEAWEAEG